MRPLVAALVALALIPATARAATTIADAGRALRSQPVFVAHDAPLADRVDAAELERTRGLSTDEREVTVRA